MSDSASPARISPSLRWFRIGIYLLLVVAVGIAGYAGYLELNAKATVTQSQESVVNSMGLVAPMQKHLAANFTDTQGRLLADTPTDPTKQLDPETLIVSYHEDADTDVQPVDWAKYCEALSKATGRKVTSQVFNNSVDDVAAVKDGRIHVLALHAADTPYLVNNAGFIPIAVLGNDSGANGNKLDLVVSNKSSIKQLSDLKGHTLTCTAPISITGYRAAISLLMLDANLRPNVDYLIDFSLKQKKSIKGIVDGEYEAAALSDDKVQSMLEAGTLKKSDYTMIYQSAVIPRLTLGYLYNLKPELAEKIKQASLDFTNEAGPVDEDGGKPMRFKPVDYKKDFELVRRIDDSFDPRFGMMAKVKTTSDNTAPTTTPVGG